MPSAQLTLSGKYDEKCVSGQNLLLNPSQLRDSSQSVEYKTLSAGWLLSILSILNEELQCWGSQSKNDAVGMDTGKGNMSNSHMYLFGCVKTTS